MDYEQKYKNALERAKEIISYYKEHNRGDEASIEDLEGIFPELKESEDERIRNWLIAQLKIKSGDDNPRELEDMINKSIAWLEKQGEQREQLINKACDLLVDCIEDFMFRRMEIWGEESKKQTLENLRKAMKGG